MYHSTVHLGGTKFVGADQTAILAFYSKVMFHNEVDFINNTGIAGGALALYSTRLYFANTANISFINNRALTVGGAIYLELGETVRPESDFRVFLYFYQVLPPLESSVFQVFFRSNSAKFGGEDIYGTYLNSTCQVSYNYSSFTLDPYEHFHFETNNSISSVSSIPDHVCVCDSNGTPECAELSKIFMTRKAYPGETITIPTVIVGGDFGTTIGSVYIGFLGYDYQSSHKVSQYQKCTDIFYTLNPTNDNSSYVIMHLSTSPYGNDQYFQSLYHNTNDVKKAVEWYRKNKILPYALITTPVFITITLLDCPPGLSLQIGNNTEWCDCHPELRTDIQCRIDNNNVHFLWSSNAWIGVDTSANVTETNRILYSGNCPFDYCREGKKNVDYMKKSDPDDQCAFKRAGRLCGRCREGFSLTIGSSHCIPCSNNNYLALLIFFAAAGFLLVLFISIVNLTVAQGMINGLVFYANIVWAYQSIALPQECSNNRVNSGLSFLYIFLAWINLDFGIETCFI